MCAMDINLEVSNCATNLSSGIQPEDFAGKAMAFDNERNTFKPPETCEISSSLCQATDDHDTSATMASTYHRSPTKTRLLLDIIGGKTLEDNALVSPENETVAMDNDGCRRSEIVLVDASEKLPNGSEVQDDNMKPPSSGHKLLIRSCSEENVKQQLCESFSSILRLSVQNSGDNTCAEPNSSAKLNFGDPACQNGTVHIELQSDELESRSYTAQQPDADVIYVKNENFKWIIQNKLVPDLDKKYCCTGFINEAVHSELQIKGGQYPEIVSGDVQSIRDEGGGGWVVDKVLGQGASGTCYLCYDINTEAQFVVKEVPWDKFRPEEASTMLLSQSPHTLRLYGILMESSNVLILMEYAGNDCISVLDFLRKGTFPDFEASLNISWQLWDVLDHLTRQGIVHNDISVNNILLEPTADGKHYNIKLIDFGAALLIPVNQKYVRPTDMQFLGTASYCSPEKARDEEYGFSSDVWSGACLLYQLCCGKEAWHKVLGDKYATAIYVIGVRHLLDYVDFNLVHPAFRQVLESCWKQEKSHRSSADDLKKLIALLIEANKQGAIPSQHVAPQDNVLLASVDGYPEECKLLSGMQSRANEVNEPVKDCYRIHLGSDEQQAGDADDNNGVSSLKTAQTEDALLVFDPVDNDSLPLEKFSCLLDLEADDSAELTIGVVDSNVEAALTMISMDGNPLLQVVDN